MQSARTRKMHLSACHQQPEARSISAPKNSFVCARCVNLKVNAAACNSKLDNSPRRYMYVCVQLLSIIYKTLFYAHFGSNNTSGARAEYMRAVERSH